MFIKQFEIHYAGKSGQMRKLHTTGRLNIVYGHDLLWSQTQMYAAGNLPIKVLELLYCYVLSETSNIGVT